MKRTIFFLIAILFLTVSLSAAPFGNTGLVVVSERSEDGGKAYTLQDDAGRQFVCVVEGTLADQSAANIETLAKRFYAWKHIVVSSLRFRVTGDLIEASILLQESSYKSVSLVPHVPAGLQFFLRDTLEYDFRIASQNNFIRLKGWYFTEEQLLDRLVEAVKNPGDFIKSQDPEYLFNALSALEKDFAESTARIDELTGRVEELAARIDELSAASSAEIALLRNAILALHNKSLFGPAAAVPQEVIDRIVALKGENEALTAKEIAAQLKAEGMTASAKAVSLVLAVYFNQFE